MDRQSAHDFFVQAPESQGFLGCRVKDYWSKLLPFTDGYYTNEVADEHQPQIDDNYRGNIGRLRQLERQYDPQNLFRLNANILPA